MSTHLTSEQLDTALRCVQEHLLSSRDCRGFWEGRLSSSALANAVASFALAGVDARKHRYTIARALRWIIANVNPDGGWGDTVGSPSNISATILCWSALTALDSERTPRGRGVLDDAENWLRSEAGSLNPDDLVRAVRARYGADNTFSVPILAMCAMAGRLGPKGFSKVPQLPFELATAPPSLYRWIRFSVVSYAMPALLAMGRLVHRRRPSLNLVSGIVRDCLTPRALRMVEKMQPPHGGFQDSAVLTGFVVMGLVGAGHRNHDVVRKGEEFLASHIRRDGSWPIDTNLSIWLSSLAVRALGRDPDESSAYARTRLNVKQWLLRHQHRHVHPMTNSPPGGWGWTDQAGSIPDGDDTASVLIALPKLGAIDKQTRAAGLRGLTWLMDLQNADGGIPAFCRGWGRLRFDRSCPTMTATFLLAADTWRLFVPDDMLPRLDAAVSSGVEFLHGAQATDGSWVSLWFGNQHGPDQRNPVYGTARVVLALSDLQHCSSPGMHAMIERGCGFLVRAQNPDGGWCGYSGIRGSIEETALSVSALAGSEYSATVVAGVKWLLERTGAGRRKSGSLRFDSAPIGLYFDRLWYHEELYPVIFTAEALRRVREFEHIPEQAEALESGGLPRSESALLREPPPHLARMNNLPQLTLIQPPIEDAAYPAVPFGIEPLSLLVIGSLTPRDKFRVKIIDGMIGSDRSRLIDPDSALVGITVTTPVREAAYRIAAEYRKLGIPVIMGGCHVILDPDDVRPHCDAIVIGEVEDTWQDILSDFLDGRLRTEYRCDQPAAFDIPADRAAVPGYRRRYPFLSAIQTTRGCPNRCTFCVPAVTYGSTVRHRSIASVVAEIESVKARMGRRTFGFTEDNFFADSDYAVALMRALTPLNIRWAAQMRIDAARDDELLDLMVESGCFAAFVGLESTSQAALNEASKGCSVEEHASLVKKLRDRGILVIASFTIGYDCDSEAVHEDTLGFCRETGIEIPLFVTLMPYKGTRLFEQLVGDGRMDPRTRPGSNPLAINFRPLKLDAARARLKIVEMYRHYYDANYLWRNFKHRLRHRQLGRGILFLVFYAVYFTFVRRIGRGKYLCDTRVSAMENYAATTGRTAEIC